MSAPKYIAFYACEGDIEFFETFEEAKKWLEDYDDDCHDGYPEESTNGGNYIAKITHQSFYKITDKKEDYHEHTENCPDDCEKEEWPYDSDFDEVGKIIYREIK